MLPGKLNFLCVSFLWGEWDQYCWPVVCKSLPILLSIGKLVNDKIYANYLHRYWSPIQWDNEPEESWWEVYLPFIVRGLCNQPIHPDQLSKENCENYNREGSDPADRQTYTVCVCACVCVIFVHVHTERNVLETVLFIYSCSKYLLNVC